MPSALVEFEVSASSGIQSYWIAVGDADVPLVNGKGAIELRTGQEHMLVWWMFGNPGDSISILGKSGGQPVVHVKESKIPEERLEGAGYRRFIV